MGLYVGMYDSARYFVYNLDLYLLLGHLLWADCSCAIYNLAHPFKETEDRYWFALPNPQRIHTSREVRKWGRTSR